MGYRRTTMRISRILHAGYVFTSGETQIVFDPIFENPFSGNCYAFPDVRFDHEKIKNLRFSAVFISHFHDDHCSLESLNLLDRQTPIYVYCLFDEIFSLIRAMGFVHVHALRLNVSVKINEFEIIPRRALDHDVDSLFQIKAAGLNVLNVVDSWIDHETLELLAGMAPWDLVLWPFQTMRELEVLSPSRAQPASRELPPEWIEQLSVLSPRYVVPSSCQFIQESWSWYNQSFFPISYRQFRQEVEAALPEARVVRLDPSVTVRLNKDSLEPCEPLSWIQRVDDQEVDYDYIETRPAPTTAEIAMRFSPLTKAQSESVVAYCRSGLLEKFRSLEPSEEDYFKTARLWRLSIFDHTGAVTQFHYRLHGAEIELIEPSEDLAWTTEISIAKLYAALNFGETLTSLYMRINDQAFAPEIENEIQSVDVVEDPLVRCLFMGAVAAYQTAQLKRLGY